MKEYSVWAAGGIGNSNGKGETLPSVAGRMRMTHEDFQRACQVELGRLQEDHLCDNRLVHLLCEAVRCSRECCEIATARTGTKAKEGE